MRSTRSLVSSTTVFLESNHFVHKNEKCSLVFLPGCYFSSEHRVRQIWAELGLILCIYADDVSSLFSFQVSYIIFSFLNFRKNRAVESFKRRTGRRNEI